MLSDVLHCFAENGVIHQFNEILLKIVCSVSPKLGVAIDVGFHPFRLIEFNHSMNVLQNQSV